MTSPVFRKWCNERFPTSHQSTVHFKSCMWKCKEANCSKEPLVSARQIKQHIAMHSRHKAKLARLASAIES